MGGRKISFEPIMELKVDGWNNFIEKLTNDFAIWYINKTKQALDKMAKDNNDDFLISLVDDYYYGKGSVLHPYSNVCDQPLALANIWDVPISFNISASHMLLLLGYEEESRILSDAISNLIKNEKLWKKVDIFQMRRNVGFLLINDSGLSLIPKHYNIPEIVKFIFDDETGIYQLAINLRMHYYYLHIIESELNLNKNIPYFEFPIFRLHDFYPDFREALIKQLTSEIVHCLGEDIVKILTPIFIGGFYIPDFDPELFEKSVYNKLLNNSEKKIYLINLDDDRCSISDKLKEFINENEFINTLALAIHENMMHQIKSIIGMDYALPSYPSIQFNTYVFLETDKNLFDGDIFLLANAKLLPFYYGPPDKYVFEHSLLDHNETWGFDLSKYIRYEPDCIGKMTKDSFIQLMTGKIYLDKNRKVVRNFIDRLLTLMNLRTVEIAKKQLAETA